MLSLLSSRYKLSSAAPGTLVLNGFKLSACTTTNFDDFECFIDIGYQSVSALWSKGLSKMLQVLLCSNNNLWLITTDQCHNFFLALFCRSIVSGVEIFFQ